MASFAPLFSKDCCSGSQMSFSVRRRPRTVHGGGFVVTNCSQELVFIAEGCGTIGIKGNVILRDCNGMALLLMRKKAASLQKQWKAYNIEDGTEKLIFSAKEPLFCFARKCLLKVQVATTKSCNAWDLEINGSFNDRSCAITDKGTLVAEVKAHEDGMNVSKDLFHVTVHPGFDHSFVFGLIAILDNMHEGSTSC